LLYPILSCHDLRATALPALVVVGTIAVAVKGYQTWAQIAQCLAVLLGGLEAVPLLGGVGQTQADEAPRQQARADEKPRLWRKVLERPVTKGRAAQIRDCLFGDVTTVCVRCDKCTCSGGLHDQGKGEQRKKCGK
jgi:hypothetical protein